MVGGIQEKERYSLIARYLGGYCATALARAYAPYGETQMEITQSPNVAITPYGFTGEWTDATGLVYLRARYYSPPQGRFRWRVGWEGEAVQPMSYNKWLYVEGNPVRYVDPSGLCVFCEVGERVRVDTRGFQIGSGKDIQVRGDDASALYSEPSPYASIIKHLRDNEIVTILSAPSNSSADWGWRKIETWDGSIGWVRNRSLLDKCLSSWGGGFGCLPLDFQVVSQVYGFGPNLYAERLCKGGPPCQQWYSSLRGLHNGIDFVVAAGTPLIWIGAGEGTVVPYGGDASSPGAFAVDYGGKRVVYGHISRRDVPYYSKVRPGQMIGLSGLDHLHLGVRNVGAYGASGSIFHNPLVFFEWENAQKIISKMWGEGWYGQGYGPYSILSFDNSYQGAQYWFWNYASCERLRGIVTSVDYLVL